MYQGSVKYPVRNPSLRQDVFQPILYAWSPCKKEILLQLLRDMAIWILGYIDTVILSMMLGEAPVMRSSIRNMRTVGNGCEMLQLALSDHIFRLEYGDYCTPRIQYEEMY